MNSDKLKARTRTTNSLEKLETLFAVLVNKATATPWLCR